MVPPDISAFSSSPLFGFCRAQLCYSAT